MRFEAHLLFAEENIGITVYLHGEMCQKQYMHASERSPHLPACLATTFVNVSDRLSYSMQKQSPLLMVSNTASFITMQHLNAGSESTQNAQMSLMPIRCCLFWQTDTGQAPRA